MKNTFASIQLSKIPIFIIISMHTSISKNKVVSLDLKINEAAFKSPLIKQIFQIQKANYFIQK